MKNMNFNEAVERSIQLRKVYHRLEREYHEKEWTVDRRCVSFPDRCWFGRSSKNVSTGALANRWGHYI